MSILSCLATEHNILLVVLAALVCTALGTSAFLGVAPARLDVAFSAKARVTA